MSPREGRLDCPRCGKAMEQGYLLERGDQGAAPTKWIEGPPERSWWTGLKYKHRRALEVRSWRCRGCGLLESYAPDDSLP